MSEELKIKKERVLAAAEKCEEAKGILKELFPEIFEKEYEEKYGKWGEKDIEIRLHRYDDGLFIVLGTHEEDKAISGPTGQAFEQDGLTWISFFSSCIKLTSKGNFRIIREDE